MAGAASRSRRRRYSLLGPDRQDIEKRTGKQWNQTVAPKDEELAATVTMVGDLLAHVLSGAVFAQARLSGYNRLTRRWHSS